MSIFAQNCIYQLIDHFTLFYYSFLAARGRGENYWKSILGTPTYNTWSGLAFERTCLWHIPQIKMKLGISGVVTSEYAWRCSPDSENGRKGMQVDLLIDRSDGIIDLCEIKNYKEPYAISSEYATLLQERRNSFIAVTGTKKAVHTVLISAEGLQDDRNADAVQAVVTLDDLFRV